MGDIRLKNLQKYPFLTKDDPKINKTSEEMREEIDLEVNCILPKRECGSFFNVLMKNKDALSLYGETGECDYEVELKVKSDESRFIRPYYVSFERQEIN